MNLSTNSQNLMSFFTKNNHINKINQTKRTDTIISGLYYDILEGYKNLLSLKQKGKYYTVTIKKIVNASQIPKPKTFNASSFQKQVREHIDQHILYSVEYKFSLIDREITIYFMTEEENTELQLELYNEYVKNNLEMAEIIKGSRGAVLTNDRKTYYEVEAMEKLKMWYTLIISIYWILVVTFILSIFFSTSTMSRTKQIMLVVLLILYPFIIHKVVVYWYNLFTTTIKNTETNIYMDL